MEKEDVVSLIGILNFRDYLCMLLQNWYQVKMKTSEKIILFFIFILIFSFINYIKDNLFSKNENNNIALESSQTIEERIQVLRKDSCLKDSIAIADKGVAIENIKFGINKNAFKNEVRKFTRTHTPEKRRNAVLGCTQIDSICGDFTKSDKLFRVRIYAYGTHFENFRKRLLKEHKEYQSYLKRYGISNDGKYSWKVGNRILRLEEETIRMVRKLGPDDRGTTQYKICLNIFDERLYSIYLSE